MVTRKRDLFGEFDRDTGALVGLSQGLAGSPSVPILSSEQTQAMQQVVAGSITSCVYNGTSGRLESYMAGGVPHTITWVGNVGTIANTTGAPSRVVTLNGSGQVVSFV